MLSLFFFSFFLFVRLFGTDRRITQYHRNKGNTDKSTSILLLKSCTPRKTANSTGSKPVIQSRGGLEVLKLFFIITANFFSPSPGHSGQRRQSPAVTAPGCGSRPPRAAGVPLTLCSSYEPTRTLHSLARRDQSSLAASCSPRGTLPANTRPLRLRLPDG